MASVEELLLENRRRADAANAKFNPITGEGSIGERTLVEIPDFPIRKQWLPKSMLRTPLVRKIIKAGSIRSFLESMEGEVADVEEARQSPPPAQNRRKPRILKRPRTRPLRPS